MSRPRLPCDKSSNQQWLRSRPERTARQMAILIRDGAHTREE
jgi:hypothetical protein